MQIRRTSSFGRLELSDLNSPQGQGSQGKSDDGSTLAVPRGSFVRQRSSSSSTSGVQDRTHSPNGMNSASSTCTGTVGGMSEDDSPAFTDYARMSSTDEDDENGEAGNVDPNAKEGSDGGRFRASLPGLELEL